MNSTNLCTQPEHRQLFVQDELHAAAYDYAKSVLDLRSAISSGVPRCFTDQLTRNMIQLKSELEQAAMAYFDNVYDGDAE